MKNIFLFPVLILLIYFGCGEDQSTNTITTAEDYSSILFTDEFGNSLGGDTTDWCYKPCLDSFWLCNKLYPAFPNPVNDTVNVRFDVFVSSAVKLYFLNSATDTVMVLTGNYQPGSYWVRSSKHSLGFSAAYKRIYIEIKNFTCYGDIQFL